MKYYSAHKYNNHQYRASGNFYHAFSLLRRIFCLALLLGASSAMAETVRLAWDANPESDISGYKVKYGTSPGNLSSVVDVGNATTASLNLTAGTTYYFSVTAYNTASLESVASTVISTTPVPADTDADSLPDAWPVPHVALRLRCSACGSKNIVTRPN